ncbi:MAG TPA: hypothetical protein VMT98_03110 [Verrucomicrobiae bacterium]|nr:hypothetical protein [Verrucomicrobiae bacterium]
MALSSAPTVEITTVSERPVPMPSLEWGPAIAGAIAAAAISFLLLTFGAAVGFSITSPWRYAGASALAVTITIALWTVLVQIGSFAAGGYLAGRMRSSWGESLTDEGRFRNGIHGFMVWAIGVLMGALVLAFAASTTVQTAGQAASGIGSMAVIAAAGGNAQAGETPADYAIDFLLRPASGSELAAASTPATAQAQPLAVTNDLRLEVARIYAAAVGSQELTQADRDYLARLVAERTGLPPAEAEKRVDASVAELSRLETRLRQQADAARKAAIITGFTLAASLLVGCAAACAGAALGGRHRDSASAPLFFGKHFW